MPERAPENSSISRLAGAISHSDALFIQRVASSALVLFLALIATACASNAPQSEPGNAASAPLKVVATTTIVGDVVRQVGGDAIDLTVMLPVGADPHGFEPAPADIATISRADAVFINGLQLESFLTTMAQNAGGNARIVAVSDGITPLEGEKEIETDAGHDDEAEHGGNDPHTWTDPNNVMVWVDNIERALSELDPANAGAYATNAAAYKAELQALDSWIREQVASVPEDRRMLVTDHAVFSYFVDRYGFQQVGAVVPGYSTLAEPSAQQLASLEDTLRALGVKAIFVGNTVNSNLSQRVAADTGIQVVSVYTGSLSDAGGPAATYLDYMRYNVAAFIQALAG